MEESQELSSHPSELSIDNKCSGKTVDGNSKKKAPRHSRRLDGAGLLDTISILVLGESDGERVYQPSSVDALEDCSTSTIETTDCIMASIESAESVPISNASTSSDFKNHHHLATLGNWSNFFGVLKMRPGASSHGLPLIPKLTKRNNKRIKGDVPEESSSLNADQLCCFKSSWKNFLLSELQEATDNFSRENLIGEGGYAEVYRGKLKNGEHVAIKRLTRGSPEEMTVDFLSELGIIVHVDHPNIAQLIGYGVDGGMHLVLQLSPHGSLASLLYDPGSKEKLNWCIRFKVALGAAEGLSYLHEGCQRRIIHKDIKPANILLTKDFDAQISDFGLSKWLPDQWTHLTVSKVEGTFGYLPPEIFMHGVVNEKTDVYAFGVVLLELITGRQVLYGSQKSLVMWAKPLIRENKIDELVDPTLGDAYDFDQLNLLVAIASICTHQSAPNRPRMRQACPVVYTLKGDLESLEKLKQLENAEIPDDLLEEDP
ncbi:hypothetical protein V6N13_085491 [Hibiscus sabdariffa]|uniref:Protein kinase domain-containing protein n=1 Tax=Hibiscus sabdariffa TaxID=183260 RepID=A0ABR2D2L5_9ROSI